MQYEETYLRAIVAQFKTYTTNASDGIEPSSSFNVKRQDTQFTLEGNREKYNYHLRLRQNRV